MRDELNPETQPLILKIKGAADDGRAMIYSFLIPHPSSLKTLCQEEELQEKEKFCRTRFITA